LFLLASDRNIVNHLMVIAKMCISKFRCGEACQIDLIFEKELLLRKHLVLNNSPTMICLAKTKGEKGGEKKEEEEYSHRRTGMKIKQMFTRLGG